jgi:hypothetical protein
MCMCVCMRMCMHAHVVYVCVRCACAFASDGFTQSYVVSYVVQQPLSVQNHAHAAVTLEYICTLKDVRAQKQRYLSG